MRFDKLVYAYFTCFSIPFHTISAFTPFSIRGLLPRAWLKWPLSSLITNISTAVQEQLTGNFPISWPEDPNFQRKLTKYLLTLVTWVDTSEPDPPFQRPSKFNDYSPLNQTSARLNATLIVLVRNSELAGILQSMRELEKTWNHKFNYPWIFFNDEPFTTEFKRATRAATNASVQWELIPSQHWDVPGWISRDMYQASIQQLGRSAWISTSSRHRPIPRLEGDSYVYDIFDSTTRGSFSSSDFDSDDQVSWPIPHYEDYPKPPYISASGASLTPRPVQYMSRESYHQMCRWNSGYFYRHPALDGYDYYWRVEPNVHFYCNIDYDVFAWMRDHEKLYGFTLALYDGAESIASLWPETKRFLADLAMSPALHSSSIAYPASVFQDLLNRISVLENRFANQSFVNPVTANISEISYSTLSPQDRLLAWILQPFIRPEHNELANGYSTCHFWSNFEIASLSIWRDPLYTAYFDYLDSIGGFFYERWGDAPVHTLALALFTSLNASFPVKSLNQVARSTATAASSIHWFRDIGYKHAPYINCPNDPGRCTGCIPGMFTDGNAALMKEDCRAQWVNFVGREW